jgi:hypothetical protein
MTTGQITTAEQSLYANLIAEAIQIHGHDVYYLDRTLVAEDTVLGEDALSKFNTQVLIEMYMEDSDGGYAGEQELMTQFGLQILVKQHLLLVRNDFKRRQNRLQIETGHRLNIIWFYSIRIWYNFTESALAGDIFYIVNETDATDADRPFEGDAIYHPILKKLFEINFVDHDDPFHQLDNNPVYKMRCRLFDYGSEALDTGITDIDAIEDSLGLASSDYQLTLEQATGTTINQEIRINHDISESGLLLDETDSDNIIGEDETTLGGESILLETGGDEYLIQEDYIVGDGVIDKTAQNELFETLDDTILDFSESNPFGDAGSAN